MVNLTKILVDPEDWDARPDSLLTKGHRKYILGEKEFTGDHAEQHENTVRQRIRNRITNGLQDFEHVRRLSERDQELIFRNLGYDDPATEGIVHCLAFIYKNVTGYSPMDFEYLLDRAIRTAEMDRLAGTDYRLSGMEIAIVPEYEEVVTTSDIRGKLDRGEGLTDEEIGRLVRAGELEPEELEELQGPLTKSGDKIDFSNRLCIAPLERPSERSDEDEDNGE